MMASKVLCQQSQNPPNFAAPDSLPGRLSNLEHSQPTYFLHTVSGDLFEVSAILDTATP